MSLHLRYTNAKENSRRIQVKFSRQDLLWKTDRVLTSPLDGQVVKGLPIPVGGLMVVGPTILDMMVRTVMLVSELPEDLRATLPPSLHGVAVWTIRDTKTLWRNPAEEKKRQVKEVEELQHSRAVDHPFKVALASGGLMVNAAYDDFVTVVKASTVTLSDIAFKLATGMYDGIGAAYTQIGKLATDAWEADLQRAQVLWQCISDADGFLVEDDYVKQLRPLSSVSEEVEQLILRQACIWLGVDPDMDCRRGRGRPQQGEAGDEGEIVRVTVNAENQVIGKLKKDYFGVAAGTDLADLGLRRLIQLLGSLRSDEFNIDGDLLEAYLDAASPNWRETAASYVDSDGPGETSSLDPYEVLGVPRDAPLEEVTRAYRRTMQRIHPDIANVSAWFAKVVATAYRTIRQERGAA